MPVRHVTMITNKIAAKLNGQPAALRDFPEIRDEKACIHDEKDSRRPRCATARGQRHTSRMARYSKTRGQQHGGRHGRAVGAGQPIRAAERHVVAIVAIISSQLTTGT